jgi:hypothetical protein
MLTGKHRGFGMAKYQTDDGEEERPLIFNDPELVKQMKALRDKAEEAFGDSGYELCGVRADKDGAWVGVFRRKNGA